MGFLRMFIARLMYLGVKGDEIRTMVAENPARLLGLPPGAISGTPG